MGLNEMEIKGELKRLIVDTLRIDGVQANDIKDAEPLFSPTEGLGLDSLNALELLSAIEFKWKVRFPNDGSAKQHFQSVDSLAAFIRATAQPA